MYVVIDNFQSASWWFQWGMKNYNKADTAFFAYDAYLAKQLAERAVEDLTVFKTYQNERGISTPFTDLFIAKANKLSVKSQNVIFITSLVERLLNLE